MFAKTQRESKNIGKSDRAQCQQTNSNKKEHISMEKLMMETAQLMTGRFGNGRDNIMALATVQDNIPYVRTVDAYYENSAFYVITHALSKKMKQIEKNPVVAISGEWFTAHGKGINLGYFGEKENAEIAAKLKSAFSEWIDNGHNDFSDVNTCILCVQLTDGILYACGNVYEIDFTK